MVVQDEPKVEKEPKIEKEPAKKVIVETNEGPVKPRTNTISYNTNSKIMATNGAGVVSV